MIGQWAPPLHMLDRLLHQLAAAHDTIGTVQMQRVAILATLLRLLVLLAQLTNTHIIGNISVVGNALQ
ncbi:hypothetical protein [Thermorudis peleae]|uniref:hypothetical protein n=1 Tax=Thermorudis peleae TaxID=1382356 RepID=UPI00056E544E|nr:hypothetical protein [Thermorudis peleae]